MGTKLHGKDGSITFAAGYVVGPDNWAGEVTADEHDITDFTAGAAGFAEYGTGLVRGTITAEGFCETATALKLAGVTGAATCLLDGTEGLSGTLHVTSFNVTVPVADYTRWTMTARFSGTIAIETT